MTFATVRNWFGSRRQGGAATLRQGEVVLSREQILARVERGAKRRLGMSAQQMVSAYHRGALPDPGCVADLMMLTRLLPPNDPLLKPSGR